jgi:hypothetical protein
MLPWLAILQNIVFEQVLRKLLTSHTWINRYLLPFIIPAIGHPLRTGGSEVPFLVALNERNA